jgi:hypothetical protein
MQLPKISAPLVISGLALAVSLGGVGAAATGLINGASIKPSTITGRQIKNRSVPIVKLSGTVPTSFPKHLPPGATVQGSYWVGGTAGPSLTAFYSAISWGSPLRYPYQVQHVAVGGLTTPQCPGSYRAPTAARGYVCFYSEFTNGSPNGPSFIQGSAGVGFDLLSSGAGATYDLGTWAVTGN